MPYYVYRLASRRHGTLYLGVTNDLARRVDENRRKLIPAVIPEPRSGTRNDGSGPG
jgi:predicted GIY-YIG superfamily endonuclease